MKTLKDLTPEIEAGIPQYIERGLKGCFDGQRYHNFNLDDAIKCVEWNYKQIVKEKPVVLVAENPLEANLMISALKKEKPGKNYLYYLFTMNIYSNCYYQWFKFIKDEFKLPLTIETEFEECFQLYEKSNIYCGAYFDNLCVVVKYPKYVFRDAQNNLHNINGVAVEWAYSSEESKWNCYYIHGVNISKEMFTKLSDNTYTFEDFVSEEIKTAALSFIEEKYGSEALFRFLSENLTETDTFVDKKNQEYLEGTTKGMNVGVYTLFKGSIGEIQLAFVRCYCPSTDRMFFLGVNPENTNAKDAIASLYRVPKSLVNEIKYIQRQGERFSTVFTDKGNQMLKTLSKEELADLVSISGDKYFSLMTYEY
jgi:hypothetical protein